jgi:phytoene desaturase
MMESDGARGPRDDAYDVVVVGCGLGGISAAALLAKAGQKVLAVERQDGVGGCAHAFTRGPYVFDPAIHILEEAKDGRFIDMVLRYLEVRDRCNLIRVHNLYRSVFPDFVLDVPSGRDEIVEAHVQAFPEEADGIRKYFGLHGKFFSEAVHMAMTISLRNLEEMVERFPVFFGYRNATVSAALDECFTDIRVKGLCSSIWPYMGLPPSRLSFYTFSQLTSVLIDGGSYYCEGSFQNLADAFAYALEQNGGDLVVGREVNEIIVEDGRVSGVKLDDGREIQAPVVISNADATQTFERLVGSDKTPPSLARRIKRMEPSLSAVVIYAATDLDLSDAAHETFLYKHWDHDETYKDILAGRPGGMWANIPTVEDPSLAPDGQHIVILTSLAPYDVEGGWASAEKEFADSMLRDFDELVFPGLRDHLTFFETATPPTLERFTLNHRGAIYGWAVTPNQTGSKRLSHDTPIGGLYLSGHWTHEGPASFRVILSGIQTGRMVLEKAGLGDTVPTFRPTDLPPLE